MWMQVLMLTPYIAIASSFVLAITITAICYSQPAHIRAAGFAV